MARQHKHHHRQPKLLAYDAAAVPEGGAAVFATLSGLTLSFWKEPAGHFFHIAALKQAGLYGGWPVQAWAGRSSAGHCCRRRR